MELPKVLMTATITWLFMRSATLKTIHLLLKIKTLSVKVYSQDLNTSNSVMIFQFKSTTKVVKS